MAGKKHPTEKVGRKKSKPDIHIADKLKALHPKKLYDTFMSYSRNVRLASILAAVLILVGVLSIAFTGDTEQPQGADEAITAEVNEETASFSAQIEVIEGTLETKNEEGLWEAATRSLEITAGTSLKTVGAASRAAIALEDGTTLRLDANSEIEFLSLSGERVEVQHISGYVYNRVTTSDSRTYIMTSTDAQYEALGTAFKTATTGDEQSVEIYESSVVETNTNRKPQAGEKLTVKSTTEPSKDNTIEELDIEAVKNDSFIQWNIALDKQNDLFKDKLGFLSDTEAPGITITDPEDGDTVLLEPSATEGVTTFTGTTEKGARLTVQSKSQSGSEPINITVENDGSFTSPSITAPLGSSVFEFVVKDRVGNTATKNIRINFQRKSQPVISDAIVLNVTVATMLEATWSYLGSVNAEDGVKLVWSEESKPSYPDDDSKYAPTGTGTTVALTKFDSGKTYYLRACEYDADEDECILYSNEVEVQIP